ncbi:YycH family regulatory protein [Staphylococcus auricularis]|uniref:Two-component system activity regulator YycH n=1 Tax=Staphylococcus auricularis TaxID=29379 RepID=A0AAW7MDM0_9STAP|nr:two-component system activity regulator YycH [Staphylococcus auricularis]MDC6327164.1 two-component system activity regulator YycH [Staphylococcus auricularis]MDN4533126.1 two-component system activity regulator YycH [Staphylococcus auricularis]MDN4533372.1 two-component system activity regulator YycH [Staphylococcus auricularis]
MSSKEIAKSAVLIALVLLSIVLTYMTWNFSPDVSDVERTEDDKAEKQSQTIGKPNNVSMDEVITPYQLIHSNEGDVKGMEAHRDSVKKINKVIQDQKVTHTQHMHSEHNLIIPDLSDDFVVFDFSYDMPLSTYLGQVMNIEARVPNDFNFNRLLINEDQNGKLQMYAISKDRHDVVKMKSSASATQFSDTLDNLDKKMKPYAEIITNKDTVDKATHIFAPSEEQKLKSYRTIYSHFSVDTMNAILFNDSVVVRSAKSGTTTYNNNTGVANYNDRSEKYQYKNLSEDRNSSKNMKEVIPSTFDYINHHGGFTDDFRLFDKDDKSGELMYQMFFNGRPTFNEDDLESLRVSWGDHGIFSYSRALLKTNITIDSGDEEKTLDGVEKVRASLANNPNINFEAVSNMTIGYAINDNPDKNDIEIQRNSELIPRWFIEYKGDWHEYDGNGGLK